MNNTEFTLKENEIKRNNKLMKKAFKVENFDYNFIDVQYCKTLTGNTHYDLYTNPIINGKVETTIIIKNQGILEDRRFTSTEIYKNDNLVIER